MLGSKNGLKINKQLLFFGAQREVNTSPMPETGIVQLIIKINKYNAYESVKKPQLAVAQGAE
jgi:hypothetical protein